MPVTLTQFNIESNSILLSIINSCIINWNDFTQNKRKISSSLTNFELINGNFDHFWTYFDLKIGNFDLYRISNFEFRIKKRKLWLKILKWLEGFNKWMIDCWSLAASKWSNHLVPFSAAVALFFNRWGKIRMLEPYQPKFIDTPARTSVVNGGISLSTTGHRPSYPLVEFNQVTNFNSSLQSHLAADFYLSRPSSGRFYKFDLASTLTVTSPGALRCSFA